jgi:hypothetical protein
MHVQRVFPYHLRTLRHLAYDRPQGLSQCEIAARHGATGGSPPRGHGLDGKGSGVDGSAARDEACHETPGWADFRQKMMVMAEICAGAAVTLALRGPHNMHAALMVHQMADSLRGISLQAAQLRGREFDDAVIEAERSRAVAEALAGAGLVPPPRGRHLRAVT